MTKCAAVAVLLFAACTTETDPLFHISGHVADHSITHVVASTPTHLAVQKNATRVDGNGNFTIALEPGHAWVVSLVDDRQVGVAMLAGSLRIDSLDAFAPRGGGSLELGEIVISEGRARAQASWMDAIAALGMDAMTADRFGVADNLATRYANPDVDNDGVIDALQPDRDFRLDVTAKLRATVGGSAATMTTLVSGDMMTGAVDLHVVDTGIVASFPPAYGKELASARMTLGAPFYGSSLGDSTPAVEAGGEIAAPELHVGTVDQFPAVGVFARAGHDAPSGEIDIATDAHLFSFADVRIPTEAQLGAGRLVVPFLHIVPSATGCTDDCQIDSIHYAWMRSDTGGWTAARAEELVHGAHLDIVRSRQGIYDTVSADLEPVPSGDYAWPTELSDVRTSELCYVAATYDDQVGMHVTTEFTNPACGY